MEFLDYLLMDNTIENTKGGFYYPSTFDSNLDYFSCLSRKDKPNKIHSLFLAAYKENRELALANLLYALDIRSGKGERDIFKISFRVLCEKYPFDALLVLPFISQLGRYDYILEGLASPIEENVFDLIRKQWDEDMNASHPSLLGKWLPSLRTHNKNNPTAFRIAKALNLKEKDYRKGLSFLRTKIDVVEKKMTNKDYLSISYETVPAKAMFKHYQAFASHDKENFLTYLSKVKDHGSEIKTEGLFCYEIVQKYLQGNYFCHDSRRPLSSKDKALHLMWDHQKNVLSEDKTNALVVCDVSGSMTSYHMLPLANSVGLALYVAEHNHGCFHDYVMSFSSDPELIHVTDTNIRDRITRVLGTHWGMSTNIDKVFKRILDTALDHGCKQEEIPEMIYIISDMEFDSCCDLKQSNFSYWKALFGSYGYVLPKIVFWNVAGEIKGTPVNKYDDNVILISGFSTKVLAMLKQVEHFSPIHFMVQVLRPYMKKLFI